MEYNRGKLRIRMKDYSMMYELMLGNFLGKKAHQTAGTWRNVKCFKEHMKEVLETIRKRIDSLEIDANQKKFLISDLEAFGNDIKKMKTVDGNVSLLFYPLFIIGSLLGYNHAGGIVRDVVFTRDLEQWFLTEGKGGGDWTEFFELKDDLMGVRMDVVDTLIKKGLSTPKIAFVLNTTDYEIQKIRKTLKQGK